MLLAPSTFYQQVKNFPQFSWIDRNLCTDRNGNRNFIPSFCTLKSDFILCQHGYNGCKFEGSCSFHQRKQYANFNFEIVIKSRFSTPSPKQ